MLAYLSRIHPQGRDLEPSPGPRRMPIRVAFRWKDYRIKRGDRQKVMRLATPEFIRRFLIHVLPDGFHRIRHYGLLASSARKANITKIRALLSVQQPDRVAAPGPRPRSPRSPCANRARVAAAPCASPKSSGAGRNRCRAPHRESRPHDTPIPQIIVTGTS